MENDKRLLITLTVGEFVELNKSLTLEVNLNPSDLQKHGINKSDIIYVDQAVALTGYTKKTIYTKVSRREIPVVSSGRPLTFSRKELNNWMRNGRPLVEETKVSKLLNNKGIK
ncbi:MAG: helix-turn-helix domain-containing protein [Flavobacteriaceae bacterium]|nr:helix-turn-helix domain-containing protein [Flavobacteriaceae bacterium]